MQHIKNIELFLRGKKLYWNLGQLITGRKVIGEKFNIDENKVQRILKKFEKQLQIEQQMSNKNRLITIKNWCQYQIGDNQTTSSEHQVNTNKNVKNIYLYYLNKYKGENAKTFREKMRVIREIKQNEDLTEEIERGLENYILGVE